MRTQQSFSRPPIQARTERVRRDGESYFEVTAASFVRASPQHTWQVLSDYERLPEFVPDLISSRILARNGKDVHVEQVSGTGVPFMMLTLRMRILIEEQPLSVIDVSLESGDMKRYTARWEIAPDTQGTINGTEVRFSGTIEPYFPLPPIIGKSIVQNNVQNMVQAVVAEIERRGAH